MRTVKRALAITLILLSAGIVAAVGAYLLLDDETLVPLLVRTLESATGTHIDYADGASISRSYSPTLSLNELVIEDVEAHYRVESQSLLLEISLPDLLLGQLDVPRLWVGDTRIDVKPAGTGRESTLAEDIQAIPDLLDLPLRPNLRDVQLSGISVQRGDNEWVLPPSRLGTVSLLVGSGKEVLELSAQVEGGGETLQLTARLSDLQQVHSRQQLPFSITARGAALDAEVAGQVKLGQPESVIKGTLRIHLPELNNLFTDSDLDIPGEVTASAELTGTFDQLALENLSADWTGPGQSSAKLDGRIADITEVKGIQLSLAGQVDRAAWLAPVLPDTMGSLNTAELSAQISGNMSRLTLEKCSLKARTADELELALSGQFALGDVLSAPKSENLDLKLVFSAPTTHAARALIFDTIPEFGAIQGSSDIRSTHGDPAFENIVVKARDKQGIQVDLKGRIAQFPLNPDRPNTGYDLDVRMQSTKTSILAKRTGLDLPIDGPLDLGYRIAGDTQALQLNQIDLSAGTEGGDLLKATGHMLFREWAQEDPLQGLDLALEYRARDTVISDAWTAQELPPLAYTLHARLHTVSGRHRIDDFRFKSIPGESLDVLHTGYAERVTFLPEFSIEGIHVESHTRTDDVATLNAYFGLGDRIPSIGPLDLRATITGTDRKLLIDNARLTAGQEGILLVEAQGRLGQIGAEKKWKVEGTDLAVSGRSSSSQALAEVLGFRLPELGPVELKANVNDRDRLIGIHDIQLRVGNTTTPALQTEGAIGDLYSSGKIHLVTKLNLPGDTLATFTDAHDLSGLGDMTGRMEISDRDGSPGIDTLRIDTAENDLFSLFVDGRFPDFSSPGTLVFDVRLGARDMQLLGALINRDWPNHGRVELTGEFRQVDKQARFNATLTSGKGKIDMVLGGALDKTPPHITGNLTASNFFIPDLFEKVREKRAKRREAGEAGETSPDKQPVFSRSPVDSGRLKAVDLDLVIDIQSFDRTMSAAESAQATVSLKSGHLMVSPATLVYPKGKADLELQVDARETLKASFSLKGANLDPWRGLNLFDEDSEGTYKAEDAELDVTISLNASGESPHELAANLDGGFYAAVRNGKISQSTLNLLFIDIIGWVSDHKKRRYAEVNCGVADYSVRQGVISTNAFFLDSKDITIAGEGTIDLGQEQLEYVFIPKKKSRVIVKSEPVDIKGPLNDPEITAIPVKSAAVKAGQLGTLLFAPYVFAGILAGQYASGEMQSKKGDDASVCLKYLETRKGAPGAKGE